MINGSQYLRRDLMIRLVRAFDSEEFEKELDRIPIKLRPRTEASSRCCIYRDRAVLKYRLMCLLGFVCEEETDEARTLESYYREALTRTENNRVESVTDGINSNNNGTNDLDIAKKDDDNIEDKDVKSAKNPDRFRTVNTPLSVCFAGCSSCPDARVVVTGNCRGCFARPCMYNCPKGAISIVNQVSTIDYSKCIKCGKCISVCPFNAIVRTTIPCEEACPVGAIHKDVTGHASIDFSKCIFCGKCFSQCPFGAVMERSQLIDILIELKRGTHLTAMIAPSASSQFPGTIEQLFTAVSKIGFSDVIEVALGAELTTRNEGEEFLERMSKGEHLMTTSCCPAYVELVRKHYPAFLKNVSDTPSPMLYAAALARKNDPESKLVFIGPCIAKRVEAKRNGIDYVLSFEELGAILAGKKIDVIACESWKLPRAAAATARNYSKSCGVTQAVLEEITADNPDLKLNSKFIDGIDKKTVNLLKLYESGKLPANFLEVMACGGGCVSGPTSLSK